MNRKQRKGKDIIGKNKRSGIRMARQKRPKKRRIKDRTIL